MKARFKYSVCVLTGLFAGAAFRYVGVGALPSQGDSQVGQRANLLPISLRGALNVPDSRPAHELKSAVLRVSMSGFNWTPPQIEEVRQYAEACSEEELKKVLGILTEDAAIVARPAISAALSPLFTCLATKSVDAALAELDSLPLELRGQLRPSVFKGWAKAAPSAALSAAELLSGSIKQNCEISVFGGWAEVDPQAAWEKLTGLPDPPDAAFQRVASHLVLTGPESVAGWLSARQSDGKEIPRGFFDTCFSTALHVSAETAGRFLDAIGSGQRGDALKALGRMTNSKTAEELLRDFPRLMPGERREMLVSWAATHPFSALMGAESNSEYADEMRAGIIGNAASHPDAAVTAWEKLPPDRQSLCVKDMARGLAVNDLSQTLAWATKLDDATRGLALETAFLWSFPRQPEQSLEGALAMQGSDRIAAVSGLTRSWAGVEPNTAANWLVHQNDPALLSPGLQAVLPKWAGIDLPGMCEWLAGAGITSEEASPALAEVSQKYPGVFSLLEKAKTMHQADTP